MLIAIVIIISVCLISLGVITWLMDHAAEGWEDESGFHESQPGEIPVSGSPNTKGRG